MNRLWGGVLAVTGFIACPCHLPLTLPLLLGVLGGTGLGGFLASNTGLVYGIATGYFIFGLGVGLFLLNRKSRKHALACKTPGRTRRPSRESVRAQRGTTSVRGKRNEL